MTGFTTSRPGSARREPEPEPEPAAEEELHWTESWPSRCLGGLGPTLHFIPEDYGQIVTYSSGQLLKNNLMMLAPLEWYAEQFPRGKNVDWDSAVNANRQRMAGSRRIRPAEARESVPRGRPLAFGLPLPLGKSGHSLPRMPSQPLVLTLIVAR